MLARIGRKKQRRDRGDGLAPTTHRLEQRRVQVQIPFVEKRITELEVSIQEQQVVNGG